MMSVVKALLTDALLTARDLTEPGEVNEEYVRGQANLIHDLFLPGTYTDLAYPVLRGAITWEANMDTAINELVMLDRGSG